jgi:5,10-methylene-tetrahydrofolate dehydrogenase/methenyl tetrahydrofolate cyclohydrolase
MTKVATHQLLDGIRASNAIRERIAQEAAEIKARRGRAPHLAAVLVGANATERHVRAYWSSVQDVAERDAALNVLRHVTATRKTLETWIGLRACRAQLAK